MASSLKPQPSHKFIGAVVDEWQLFSDNAKDYTVGLPIGFGGSSTVYAAVFQPPGRDATPCALKVLDLDALPPQSLRLLMRETQLMSLSKHPNVLRVRGSWMDGHKLFIALRLMNSGSAADVMHYGWPGGMEEEVVKCILKQALDGLKYLHINGFIHRDIKAANLLIDDDGTVLLGDLGVAASLSEEDTTAPVNSRRAISFDLGTDPARASAARKPKIGKRKSFVGTPCWMAPELISGKQYDSKADIWSFGITALELTQGRAPRSREPSAKVLMKTVQEAAPLFDRQGGQYKYSKAFKDVVESCLVKDPALRPTAAQLLDTPFFRSSKKKSFLVGAILKDLPPLVKRQEHRRQPSNRSTRTFDSWDFSLSNPVSPVTSVFFRHPLSQLQLSDSILEVDDPAGSDEEAWRMRVLLTRCDDESGGASDTELTGDDASSLSESGPSRATTPEPGSHATSPMTCSPVPLADPSSAERTVPGTESASVPLEVPPVTRARNAPRLGDLVGLNRHVIAPSPSPSVLSEPASKGGVWKRIMKGRKTR